MRDGKLFNPEMRDTYFYSPEDYVKSINEHEEYLEDSAFMRLSFQLADKNKHDT